MFDVLLKICVSKQKLVKICSMIGFMLSMRYCILMNVIYWLYRLTAWVRWFRWQNTTAQVQFGQWWYAYFKNIIFTPLCPDWPWGPINLLYSEYQNIPGDKVSQNMGLATPSPLCAIGLRICVPFHSHPQLAFMACNETSLSLHIKSHQL